MSCWRRNSLSEFAACLGLALVLFGCSREKKQGKFLASVKGKELHMSAVASHVDTNSAYAVRNYVSHWVDEQLLFDEAKKQGFDDSREFEERVREFSTQLAITMLLNKRIYEVPLEIAPSEIAEFYNTHKNEFEASENIAFVNYAAFDKRSLAVSFRNALVSGTPWTGVFNDLPAYAIMDVKDSVYLTASNSIGTMWNVIQSLEPGRISFPIQVDSLSYIVQVISKISPGNPLPLNYASSKIKLRLSIEKREKMYRGLIDSLRTLGNFEIDPSVAIRDTSSQE